MNTTKVIIAIARRSTNDSDKYNIVGELHLSAGNMSKFKGEVCNELNDLLSTKYKLVLLEETTVRKLIQEW